MTIEEALSKDQLFSCPPVLGSHRQHSGNVNGARSYGLIPKSQLLNFQSKHYFGNEPMLKNMDWFIGILKIT